jgi:class 3 adenylate cyclase
MPQRQLAAIMFTDIVGYTALMGQDEQKGLELVRRNRKIQQRLIKAFGGIWLKEMGDGILSSFQSAGQAVYCAAAIQKETKKIPELELRIGIHLGEIIFERGDVFGDGVNIAARLERMSPGRGIAVSESVHGIIHDKQGITYKSLGPRHLKNVREPIGIYKELILALENSRRDRKPYPLIGLVIGSLTILIILFAVTMEGAFHASLKLLAIMTAFLSVIFYLFGFIYREETNKKLEEFLIQINDKSGIKSIFKLFINSALSFFKRARSTKGFYFNFLILSFFVNSFSLFLASFLVEFLVGGTINDAYEAVINFPLYSSLKNAVTGHLTAGIVCSFFDLLSFHITYRLVLWASHANRFFQEIGRIFLEILLAALLICIIVVLIPWFNWVLFHPNLWVSYDQAWTTTFETSKDIANGVLIAVSSIFPTVAYLSLGVAILFIKISPPILITLYNRMAESLARDTRPVFGNLGFAMAIAAGFLSVLLLVS